jgi:hypothetical protein
MNAILRRLCLACILAVSALLPGFVLADPASPAVPKGPWVWTGDAAGLHALSLCELDQLFQRATVEAPPQGFLPGQVIAFTNIPTPNLAKWLADRHWVGKHIEPDGHFINQWRRRQALQSCLYVGPSYLDANPTLVFEYPWYTPLFGPMRDEYREIAPGLFLGRMYRRRPCVRFLGYNYLQLLPCGQPVSARLAQHESPTPEPPTATETGDPTRLDEKPSTIEEPRHNRE